ncbi:MAG: hypothetical protein KGH63_04760, partial [Candidatus Micrarchaeota archaeon]|nr:hypothetical protein [Candidatus Micrarchaeota archaeon]
MLVFQMGGPGPLASKGRDEEEMRHLIDQAVQAVHEKALMLSAQPGSQNAPSAASQVIFPLGKMEELAAYGPTPAAVWKSIAARIHDLDLGIGLKYEKDTSTFYLTKTVAPLSQPSGKEVLLTKIPPEIKVIDLSTGLIAAEMAAGIAPAQIANDLLYAITSSVSPGSQEMAELGGIYSQIEEDLVKGVFKDYRIVRDDAGHFALAQSAQEESAQAKAGVAPLPAVPAPEAAEEGGQIRKPKARKPSARLVSKEEGEFSALGTEIAGLPNTWSDAKQDRYFQWREKQMALQAAQASIVSESEPVSKNAAQTAVAGTAPVAEQAPVIAPAPSAASESQQLAQIQEVWGTGITAALAKTVIQSGAISDFNRLHALAAGSDPRAAFLKARRDFEAMLEKKDSGGQSVFEQNLGSYISLNRAFPGQIGVNDVSYHLGNGGGESTVEGMLLAAKLNPGIKAADAWKLVEPYISQTLEERGKRLQSMAQFYEDAGLSKLPGATLADVSALYAKCETYQTWPNFA